MKFIYRLFSSRFWALLTKEVNQILRDKKLLFLLIFPPTIQLLIYGFSLNPDVQHLQLGIVDYANSNNSRELVSALTENKIFEANQYFLDSRVLGKEVEQGDLDVGLVIPPEFNRNLVKNKTSEIQFLVDGVDANTAGIAQGYINQIMSNYNSQLASNTSSVLINTQTIFLYNPGLRSSWFFIPGMMGVVLTLISSQLASVTLVREKDTGTLEQLLMTPSEPWEILLAKIVPLFVMLMGDVLLGLGVGRLVFGVPFRGNLFLFLGLSGLYLFVGIGIGMILATLCRSQQQVLLMTFFINLPLIQLSGAIAPIESMPIFMKYFSLLNPLRYYVIILRGILLKGLGLEVLWPQMLVLILFAVILLSISIKRFRTQLSS
ncbi:MAG: ABC transporter permease [Xenococcaceae cyanobacterium MO_167.B27]|nr:ABC transporter permease [Xenococcaceae cyanobacterium MO_167.B27]